MSNYKVRHIDIPPPTPEEVEEEKLETRKRWAVMMYEVYLDSLSPEDRMSEEWKESKCRCQYSPQFNDLEGNEIKRSCPECER